MKTVKEKAKAYDKALESAIIAYKDEDRHLKATLERIFPELKESEDEKIRKEMIFYFTEEIPQCSIQEHSDKMREFISWLKRQEVERTKLELKAGSSYFCYKSRWERADSETFKKGLIYMCNKDGVLDNFVIKNPEQHFIEIKDERITWIENLNVADNDILLKDVDWLKSLKDRVLPQPKQGWSKEDEKMLADACIMLDWYQGNNWWKAQHIKNWFKSLKQRIGG